MSAPLRRRLTIALFATLATLAFPLAAGAQAGALDPSDRAYWQGQAAKMQSLVTQAALRQQAAEDAYSRMMSRRYPLGEAKAKIIEEREKAEKAVAQAVAEQQQFLEEARRAGVPHHWVEPESNVSEPWWRDSTATD